MARCLPESKALGCIACDLSDERSKNARTIGAGISSFKY
jgi:hypothetical protein